MRCLSYKITTLAYLLQKNFDLNKVKFFLKEILDIFTILPSSNRTLLSALSSDIKDYEEAVIEISSLENDIDYIITRNLKGFKNSKVKAISPEEFILQM